MSEYDDKGNRSFSTDDPKGNRWARQAKEKGLPKGTLDFAGFMARPSEERGIGQASEEVTEFAKRRAAEEQTEQPTKESLPSPERPPKYSVFRDKSFKDLASEIKDYLNNKDKIFILDPKGIYSNKNFNKLGGLDEKLKDLYNPKLDPAIFNDINDLYKKGFDNFSNNKK